MPNGAQELDAVSEFIAQCPKSFITISGGADPLYKIEENRDTLLTMVGVVKEYGFNTRLITREVAAVASLKGHVQQVSISLDNDVMNEIGYHRKNWRGLEVEYSLVLPAIPQAMLHQLMPQYCQLQRKLGGRLLLRENPNSIHAVNAGDMSSGNRSIGFVPKKLCLESRYLLAQPFWGHEIIQDLGPIMKYLMSSPNAYIFGGAVKHLLAPEVHPKFRDIDLIVTDDSVLDMLEKNFAYVFRRVNPIGTYPRYYIGSSTRAGKPIQIVRVKTQEEALRFVFNAQYDVDRVLHHENSFIFDPRTGDQTIRKAITQKTAALVAGPIDRSLFRQGREHVETKHTVKLMRKGFAIQPPTL